MNVLSLCDGISCLRIALQRGGHKVDNYYASEIDKNAIKCSQANWNDIIQVGDVTKLHYKNGYLNDMYVGKIDLVAFGSPCQSFSSLSFLRNDRYYGFNGKSGLFFECLRLLHEVQPKYFLFENVWSMRKECKLDLDKYMGVEGILINSNLVSYQNRKRYYWTNIPFKIPEDKHISFQDYIEKDKDICRKYKLPKKKHYIKMWANGNGKTKYYGCKNVTHLDKISTVNTVQKSFPNAGLVECEDFCRILTRRELEQAQTLPVGYTNCLSYYQAGKVIGNGWTVDVIENILRGIKNDKS